MIDSTKPIDDATPLDDISGLKLPKNKTYTLKEIYVKRLKTLQMQQSNIYQQFQQKKRLLLLMIGF